VAKTKKYHPKLPGTVYTVVEDIRNAGCNALPYIANSRFEDQVQVAIDVTIKDFGNIDILVNNASAINLSPNLKLAMERFDLMFSVNLRGTFLCSKLRFPH
jgi:citronellol/citronellal dehydrogenase